MNYKEADKCESIPAMGYDSTVRKDEILPFVPHF